VELKISACQKTSIVVFCMHPFFFFFMECECWVDKSPNWNFWLVSCRKTISFRCFCEEATLSVPGRLVFFLFFPKQLISSYPAFSPSRVCPNKRTDTNSSFFFPESLLLCGFTPFLYFFYSGSSPLPLCGGRRRDSPILKINASTPMNPET